MSDQTTVNSDVIDIIAQESTFLDGETAELATEQTANETDITSIQAIIDAATKQMQAAVAKKAFLAQQGTLITQLRADLAALQAPVAPVVAEPVPVPEAVG